MSRPKYDFQRYLKCLLLQPDPLKNSRLQIEKTQIGCSPIVFQFPEELDHIFQNLQLLNFVVFQINLGHAEHVHYFLTLVFPTQTRHYEWLQYPLQQVQSDFQFDQSGA